MPIDRNSFVDNLRGLRNAKTLTPDQISTVHTGFEHLLHEIDTLRAKLVELEGKIVKKS